MKKVMATLAILLIAGTATADEKWDNFCAETANYAEELMRGRHQGVPMQKSMELASEAENEELCRLMVTDAYRSPRYTTDEVIRRSIEDFRDKWYLYCTQHGRSR